jgi:2-dehydro-3-deoxygalactonokinase
MVSAPATTSGAAATLAAARFIGADWGSSHLRLFLVGDAGHVLDMRHSADGASVLAGGAASFAQALRSLAGDWLRTRPDLPVVACGMVGSAHGWQEVPYADCPARAADLAARAQAVATPSPCSVYIVPGLLHLPAHGAPDVMRGEETQVVGALVAHPALAAGATLVLPGTHSKWVRVDDGAITGFATHLTGELYALLRQHSVLGRLMPAATDADAFRAAPFLAGVDAARAAGAGELGHLLFSVRTLGLTGRLEGADAPDYLSGLLIGSEVAAGLRWRAAHDLAAHPVALVGEDALTERYRLAMTTLGAPPPAVLGNTAVPGLAAIHAALVGGRASARGADA